MILFLENSIFFEVRFFKESKFEADNIFAICCNLLIILSFFDENKGFLHFKFFVSAFNFQYEFCFQFLKFRSLEPIFFKINRNLKSNFDLFYSLLNYFENIGMVESVILSQVFIIDQVVLNLHQTCLLCGSNHFNKSLGSSGYLQHIE
jgi:hypothetical protein